LFLTIKEIEAYREGRLPDGIRDLVKLHLESCKDCAELYRLVMLADKVMNEEKGLHSNPFLSTRIMAGIDELERKRESHKPIPAYLKVLKPFIIGLSVAAAILIGVVVGNINNPTLPSNAIPVEMSYMNDAAIESVDLLSNQ
jgi:anti-sigma factor RsiW